MSSKKCLISVNSFFELITTISSTKKFFTILHRSEKYGRTCLDVKETNIYMQFVAYGNLTVFMALNLTKRDIDDFSSLSLRHCKIQFLSNDLIGGKVTNS